MICTKLGDLGPCRGDSGGPIVDKNKTLFGIVSWGGNCKETTFPKVYAKISSPDIFNFIQDHVDT